MVNSCLEVDSTTKVYLRHSKRGEAGDKNLEKVEGKEITN